MRVAAMVLLIAFPVWANTEITFEQIRLAQCKGFERYAELAQTAINLDKIAQSAFEQFQQVKVDPGSREYKEISDHLMELDGDADKAQQNLINFQKQQGFENLRADKELVSNLLNSWAVLCKD